MEKKMYSSPLYKDPRLPNLYTLFSKKQDHQTRMRDLKKRIQATNDVLQMEELKCRKRVLRRLGFTTASDIVDMKGRVACEISSGDELLLTELIFNGVFNTLPPEHCAGLLSCFVFTEKVSFAPLLPRCRLSLLGVFRANTQRGSKKSWRRH
jgi:ATP-dependent RNA helicase DOB1